MANNHTRRKILKATAGTVGGMSISTVSGSAEASTQETETKMVVGTANNPVTKADVKSLQRELLSKRQLARRPEAYRFVGSPKWDLTETSVSYYAMKIDENGEPITAISYSSTGSIDSFDKGLQDANKTKQNLENASTVDEYRTFLSGSSPRNTSTAAGAPSIGSEWEPFGLVNAKREESEGNLYLTAQPLVHLGPSNADEDLWAAVGNYIVEPQMYTDPGIGSHVTEYVKIEQSFEDSPIVDVDSVGSTAPSGDKDERVTGRTVSLSGGASGPDASISWSYSQPKIYRNEQTNTPNDRDEAAWAYNATSESDAERLEFRVGSNHWINDAPGCPEDESNLRWNMGETELTGRFDSVYRLPDTYEIGANWFGWVCP